MSRMPPDLAKTLDPSGKDIFAILIEEHRLVEKLGNEYQSSGDDKEKAGMAYNIIKLLSMHAAGEEMCLYPLMRVKLGDPAVNHALMEHQQVKEDLFALDNMTYGSAHFDEKLMSALNNTLQHVQEEEQQLFPALKSNSSNEEIAAATAEYVSSKPICPTRPHPQAPNRPPDNKLANTQAASLDKVRDAGRFSSA